MLYPSASSGYLLDYLPRRPWHRHGVILAGTLSLVMSMAPSAPVLAQGGLITETPVGEGLSEEDADDEDSDDEDSDDEDSDDEDSDDEDSDDEDSDDKDSDDEDSDDEDWDDEDSDDEDWDDEDSDDEDSGDTFMDALSFSASVDLTFERLGNTDLDDRTSDGVSSFLAEVTLEVDYSLSDNLEAYMELLAEGWQLVDRGDAVDEEDQDAALYLSQLYLDIDEVFEGGMLRVGRQAFYDSRGWLYADELDGVRLFYDRYPLALEASVSRERLVTENVFEEDAAEEHVNNYIGMASYQPVEDQLLSAFVLARDDRTEDSYHPIFYGLRAMGSVSDALTYWVDLATVRGRDEGDRLRGYGVDLGGSYRLGGRWSPSLTLGYAFGSGDSNPDDNIDRQFRQSGLHDNTAYLSSGEEFLYYGETLDPELSNLRIMTAGFGVLPSEYSSLDIIYHRYRQDVTSSEGLDNSALDASLTGESPDIGYSVDVVVGYYAFLDVPLWLQMGYFRPGDAFESSSSAAYSFSVGLGYVF